jgi:hypothetical protein
MSNLDHILHLDPHPNPGPFFMRISSWLTLGYTITTHYLVLQSKLLYVERTRSAGGRRPFDFSPLLGDSDRNDPGIYQD